MIFVHFSLLAGTALVALPIVLHLIMRRKPRHLEFPALRFIQRRHDTNQRRLKLRHLILLLLRAGAIALLALALARPSVKLPGNVGSQEAPIAAALVFDTAPRMDYRQENRSRLEVAREFGLRLLAQLPRGSQIAVADTRLGDVPWQVDRGTAVQKIERLETVANSQPLTRVIDSALHLLSTSEQPRRELYVFSDLTRAAWPLEAAARIQDRVTETPGVGLYVIDVGVEKPTNFALGEVRLSAQVLTNRSQLNVETQLTAIGGGGKRNVEVYLYDADRKPQKRAEHCYTLEPGQSQQVDLAAGRDLEVGTHQGFVRILGEDGLAADDTRYFTVDVKPAWRILIAAPHPAREYAGFLSEALAPTAFRKRGEAPFDCDVMDLDQWGQKDLEAYAAVCLLDPTPLEPSVWQKLVNYASEGRGVAVFLGRNAAAVDSFNEPKAQELLAAKLLTQVRRPWPDFDCYLAPREYQHPMLSGFRGCTQGVPWDQYPVFRYWELEKPAAGVSVVVPFNDDGPAVLERPLGTGRAITVTTPVSDRGDRQAWNRLPIPPAWPFGILANYMMYYLVGSTEGQLNYTAGQVALLHFDRHSPQGNYLVTPDDDPTLKFQVALDPQRRVLLVSSTDRPGNYRVQAGGEKAGVDRGFSVNLAPEQTQLERLPRENLKEIFGPYDFRLAQTLDQLDRQINTARVGRDLFPLLILIVALVLGAEHVVANRFYKEG